jgi:hypothetical protein
MKRASGTYDLILFGLLDSHTLADYSNMRIDNFVYTKESFQEAKSLLAPGGVVFIKFQVDRPWLGKRLVEMLTQVFGKPPVTFVAGSSYTAGATCFAISASGQVERQLATDSALRKFVSENRPDFLDSPAVPVTTDDWPYLYQQGRWLPGIFVSIELLVLLLGTGLYLQIPEARQRVPSLFFFSMGAGFLLLETQIVSRLALYFGTTWQVNGIVIGHSRGAAGRQYYRRTPNQTMAQALVPGRVASRSDGHLSLSFPSTAGKPNLGGLGSSGSIHGSCFLRGAFVCE